MRLIRVTALTFLLLIAWPALAPCNEASAGTLKMGEEVGVASDGPCGMLRSLPVVAYGDGVYLVVWQEGWHGDRGNSRIYSARVAPDGKVLDPRGIEIAPCKAGVQENPRAAFLKGVFLVVWQDLRNGEDCDVLGARVSLEGRVLDRAPLSIGTGPRTQAMPDVAADDKGFLVVWHGFQGQESVAKIFAVRVGVDGSVEKAVVMTPGATPRIAWNGAEHLLLYYTVSSRGYWTVQRVTWLRLDRRGRPQSRPGHMGGNSLYSSVAGMPDTKEWILVCPGGPPNFWGRTVGAQRVFLIDNRGRLASQTPWSNYGPKQGLPDPPNWVDSSRQNTRQKKIWPWGTGAVANTERYSVVVWQRFQMGGPTGISLYNSDIRAGRVHRWKALDKPGGVAVAASAAEERNPSISGDNRGNLLCVYEKRMHDGARRICAKTVRVQ